MLKLFKLFLLTTLTYSICSATGTETSGGGGAAVCRDMNKKVSSAYLLDTYEGEVRFSYNIPQSKQDPNNQLVDVLNKIQNPLIKQFTKQTVAQIIDSTEFLPQGVGMAPTSDLGKEYGVVVPDGCAIEPIGFYESNGILKISRSVYGALSETDKAAFFIHEAIYKLARDLTFQSDSARSRKAVASLFSNNLSQSIQNLDELFNSPNEYSMAYWNYNQIGTLNLNQPTSSVQISIDINSSQIENISIQCSSSYKTTRQEVSKQNFARFIVNTDNCLSYNIGIVYSYQYEPSAGDSIGTVKINDSMNNSTLYQNKITYGAKGTQKDVSFVYFLPVFHLYKNINTLPKL